jgi:LAO/AO transport system kinase
VSRSWDELVARVARGDARALARMITRVESREAGWREAMKALWPRTGSARVIGITGSPGTGKSTLTSRIARRLVDAGRAVGVIAVDPSSPFSGGALLGDRLRMREVATLPGVFIRSMATRGALGGLCQSARDVVRILDASGKHVILIETVGVGQDEVEVVRAADLVAVVCVPGQGDAVQTLKAGVMEIADVFVVNKADREGADQLVADITAMLSLTADAAAPKPPVLRTCALSGEGVEALVQALLEEGGGARPRGARDVTRVREEILNLIEGEVSRRLRQRWARNGRLDEAVRRVSDGLEDPYSAVEAMFAGLEPEP